MNDRVTDIILSIVFVLLYGLLFDYARQCWKQKQAQRYVESAQAQWRRRHRKGSTERCA